MPGDEPGGECFFFRAFLDLRENDLFFIRYSTINVDNSNRLVI